MSNEYSEKTKKSRKMSNPSVNGLDKYVVSDTGGTFSETGARTTASYAGVAVKIAIYLLITLVSAIVVSALFFSLAETNSGLVVGFLVAGPVIALVCGIIASVAPSTASITGSIYCLCYGLFIGSLAAILEAAGWGSLVLIALLCTVVVAAVMSLLYFSGTVRVGRKFRKFILTALISVVACQLLFLLVGLIIPSVWDFYFASFGLQLAVSSLMIVIATLTILFDLDHITTVVEAGLGKKYEWRAAFGLMVTLIWLFLQILRFLLIIASRANK